jgi:hypothetical protein
MVISEIELKYLRKEPLSAIAPGNLIIKRIDAQNLSIDWPFLNNITLSLEPTTVVVGSGVQPCFTFRHEISLEYFLFYQFNSKILKCFAVSEELADRTKKIIIYHVN